MKVKDISEIVSLKTLQKIQEYYSNALGFTLSVRQSNGDYILKPTNYSKFRMYIQNKPEIELEYLNIIIDAIKKSERTGQIVIFERFPDTSAFVSPIHISGRIYGFFLGGMVRYGNPDMEIATKMSNKLGVGIDDYLDAFLSLPLITPERFESAGNLIKVISTTISHLELFGNDFKIKTEEAEKQNKELSKNLEFTSTQLDQSVNRYKSIFESVYDGIYLETIDGILTDINTGGAKLLGYQNAEELIGKNFISLYVYPEDRKRYMKLIKEKGYIKNLISHIKTPSGEERYLETNANAVKDKNGNIVSIQGIFRDINEREHKNI